MPNFPRLQHSLFALAAAGLAPIAFLDNGAETYVALLVAQNDRGDLLLGTDEGCTCCGEHPFEYPEHIDFEALTPEKWAALTIRVEKDFSGDWLAAARTSFLERARAYSLDLATPGQLSFARRIGAPVGPTTQST